MSNVREKNGIHAAGISDETGNIRAQQGAKLFEFVVRHGKKVPSQQSKVEEQPAKTEAGFQTGINRIHRISEGWTTIIL